MDDAFTFSVASFDTSLLTTPRAMFFRWVLGGKEPSSTDITHYRNDPWLHAAIETGGTALTTIYDIARLCLDTEAHEECGGDSQSFAQAILTRIAEAGIKGETP